MIYSMTGFGRAEGQSDSKHVAVEIRSVNHRYLDIGVKTPKRFGQYDAAIRAIAKEIASRGKVDIFVTVEDIREPAISLHYNAELARQYVAYAECMKEDFAVDDDFTVTSLMRCPEVLTMREDEDKDESFLALLEDTVRRAGAEHASARAAEGAALASDLLVKLEKLKENAERIASRAPQILEEYREKLRERTKELLENAQLDEGRIAAEVVLFADKICIDEEMVRLLSHIESMRKALEQGGLIGRKLDFIAQEMNREANTILSKSNDLQTSEIGIELKTGIEKIREQVQNIE